MKKQVILDIVEKLEGKKRGARQSSKTPAFGMRKLYEGMWWGLEYAIKECLAGGNIIDGRPEELKYL